MPLSELRLNVHVLHKRERVSVWSVGSQREDPKHVNFHTSALKSLLPWSHLQDVISRSQKNTIKRKGIIGTKHPHMALYSKRPKALLHFN